MIPSCAVAIPIYRKFTPSERLSLLVLEQTLPRDNCFIVAPKSLKVDSSQFKIIRLPDQWFSSIISYGSLMVSAGFYELFVEFDYVLIYQLDCLIFGSRLDEFCALGFDYVAPLILGRTDGYWPQNDIVGVGGFSLRKISSFLEILNSVGKPEFAAEMHSLANRIQRNGAEDMFWSLSAPAIDPNFSVASPEVALAFGFEGDPSRSFQRSNYQQPFGCHHWNKLAFFVWYLRWIRLSLSRSLLLIPPIFFELALSETRGICERARRRSSVFLRFFSGLKP